MLSIWKEGKRVSVTGTVEGSTCTYSKERIKKIPKNVTALATWLHFTDLRIFYTHDNPKWKMSSPLSFWVERFPCGSFRIIKRIFSYLRKNNKNLIFPNNKVWLSFKVSHINKCSSHRRISLQIENVPRENWLEGSWGWGLREHDSIYSRSIYVRKL